MVKQSGTEIDSQVGQTGGSHIQVGYTCTETDRQVVRQACQIDRYRYRDRQTGWPLSLLITAVIIELV